jgi:hypothetical protein
MRYKTTNTKLRPWPFEQCTNTGEKFSFAISKKTLIFEKKLFFAIFEIFLVFESIQFMGKYWMPLSWK